MSISENRSQSRRNVYVTTGRRLLKFAMEKLLWSCCSQGMSNPRELDALAVYPDQGRCSSRDNSYNDHEI